MQKKHSRLMVLGRPATVLTVLAQRQTQANGMRSAQMHSAQTAIPCQVYDNLASFLTARPQDIFLLQHRMHRKRQIHCIGDTRHGTYRASHHGHPSMVLAQAILSVTSRLGSHGVDCITFLTLLNRAWRASHPLQMPLACSLEPSSACKSSPGLHSLD